MCDHGSTNLYTISTRNGVLEKKIEGKKAKAFLACITNIIYVCKEQAHTIHIDEENIETPATQPLSLSSEYIQLCVCMSKFISHKNEQTFLKKGFILEQQQMYALNFS